MQREGGESDEGAKRRRIKVKRWRAAAASEGTLQEIFRSDRTAGNDAEHRGAAVRFSCLTASVARGGARAGAACALNVLGNATVEVSAMAEDEHHCQCRRPLVPCL